MPEKSIWELITAKSPDTYTDGYGVTREVYEPTIIKLGRGVYHKLDDFFNGKKMQVGDQLVKPIGNIGILGGLGGLVAPEEWAGLEILDVTPQHFGLNGRAFPVNNDVIVTNPTAIPLQVPIKKIFKQTPNEARHNTIQKKAKEWGVSFEEALEIIEKLKKKKK